IDANSEEDVVECESDFSGDSIDAEPERVTSHDQCLPPSSSIAELDDLISELPATYSSFATYCDFYTNSVDGTVQPAEWRISPVSFTEKLKESVGQRLAEGKLCHVWAMCRAIEECDGLPPVRSADLTRLSALAKSKGV